MDPEILPAAACHWPLIRALSGLAVSAEPAVQHGYIAVMDQGGERRLAGAGLVRAEGSGAAAWVAVAEPWRRRGIGRALFAATAGSARTRGATRMGVWQGVSEHSGREFCARLGLAHTDSVETFETTLADAESFFGSYYRRFAERGSLPSNLASVCGDEIDWPPFQALLEHEFGPAMAARLGRIAAFGLLPNEWASALWAGARPVAVTLGKLANGAIYTDAYAVMPEFRLGWAHIASKYLVIRDLRARHPQIATYRFSAARRHGDTRKAAYLGGQKGFWQRLLQVEHIYEFDLAPEHG
ncbi:MAG: GNAT family N-acetyltransferase [Rhodocyclaceae bacterium]|nr:GNAT family N-acetyltransferase [Rhodocyclaceae bacterium]